MKKNYILLLAFVLSATFSFGQLFYENFEGTFPPLGWTKQSPDHGTGWAKINAGTNPIPGFTNGTLTPCQYGISGMAYCSFATGGHTPTETVNNQWLITPQIYNIGANFTVSFWLYKYGNYKDSLKVMVSTDSNDLASFTGTVGTIALSETDTGWVNYHFSLAAYSGQNIYIGFNEYVSDNGTYSSFFALDNVRIGTAVSVQDFSSKIYANVYPIPAKNNLNIESSNIINKIKIINLFGQVEIEKDIDSKFSKINVSELNSGVYFIQMDFDGGTVTKRFIK